MFHDADDDGHDSPLKFFRLVVSQQPANAVGVIGGQASFTCSFLTNVPAAFTTYQWQIQTDGATWYNLAEFANYYEGVTTTTLTVKTIDNFLATRTSLNFRCVATNYSGSLATNSASLTIPIHTSWQPQALAFGVGETGGAPAQVVMSLGSVPVVTGFAGPYTYNWVQTGLSSFTCLNPAAANPIWEYDSFGQPGTFASIWRCQITSGLNSVVTDEYFLFAYFATAPTSAPVETTPAAISDNGPFALVPGFFGPWGQNPPGSRWIRMVAGSTFINFQDPTRGDTTFFVSGPPAPGGAAVRFFPVYPASTPDNSFGIGCVVSYGSPP